MEEFEEQGWYTCTYCCHEDKDDFYLDKLICKKNCITIQNTTCKINTFHDVIYNDKIYHYYCFQKYIDTLPITLFKDDTDNDSDDLDDDTWLAKKKEIWQKNNISPSITPVELTNLLRENFPHK
jgi:hypothetical protein